MVSYIYGTLWTLANATCKKKKSVGFNLELSALFKPIIQLNILLSNFLGAFM